MNQMKKMSRTDGRARIIETSTSLFLELGFSGTSMSTIAKASGLTKAGLYHHFTSKEDLFSACVTEGYATALEKLEVISSDNSKTTQEKLIEAIELIYDTTTVSEVGRMSPLIAEVSRTVPTVARSFHDDYIEPQQEILWSIVAKGIDEGEFREMDRTIFLHMLFGPIVTLSLSLEMFSSFENLEELYPTAAIRQGHLDVILDLLGAR